MAKLDVQDDVVGLCPTYCMNWDGKTLKIDNKNCNHCMHCISLMPQALRPGTETGATILLGSHAPILEGAQMSWVIVPFMPMEAPFDELKEIIVNIAEWWSEHGKNRERVISGIKRVDVDELYDSEEYRPKVRHVLGKPMFLY